MECNKKIFVTQSSLPPIEDYIDKLTDIWESKWLTNNGKFHTELEQSLSRYLNIENVTLYTNGHLALDNAIKFMDLKGEVITTPFTFASTTHAIVQNGLTPIFCDINDCDYTMDISKLEELITEKTSAIIPVHVYGHVCNVEEIERISKKHNLKVIYDAAHAFGVKKNGIGISNYGDISMFSFHATKVFNTVEGGALVYHNKDYRDKLNQMKNFGILNSEEVTLIGGNSKMSEFQAAMGLCNLKYIDENIQKRKLLVERYRRNLENISGIKFVKSQDNVESNYAYFPIVVDDKTYGENRDELYERLIENEIYPRKYFYPLTNDFQCYKDIFNKNNTPVAVYISERILTLPLYPEMDINDVDRICNIIRRK